MVDRRGGIANHQASRHQGHAADNHLYGPSLTQQIETHLASIDSVDDAAVDLRNKAKAIETYTKGIGHSKEIERYATMKPSTSLRN